MKTNFLMAAVALAFILVSVVTLHRRPIQTIVKRT
jgi:hypothetical protein